MHRPVRRRLAFILAITAGVVVGLLPSSWASAEEFRFDTPVPTVIRLQSGARIQGLLIAVDQKSVTFQFRGKEKVYPNSRMRFLNTVDRSLKYRPGIDRFEKVLEAAKKLNERLSAMNDPGEPDRKTDAEGPAEKREDPSAKESQRRTRRGRTPPVSQPETRSKTTAGSGAGGWKAIGRALFGGDQPRKEPEAERPTRTPHSGGGYGSGYGGGSTRQVVTGKKCGACGKGVPISMSAGDRCPHCGVRWAKEVGSGPPIGSALCALSVIGFLVITLFSILFRRR